MQAAIGALHDQADHYAGTDWSEILSLYGLLEAMTGSPIVRLNRAVAAAMANGPEAGLAMLEGIAESLAEHHRLYSVHAHLLELAGDADGAAAEFKQAAARSTNVRERRYLTTKAARMAAKAMPT